MFSQSSSTSPPSLSRNSPTSNRAPYPLVVHAPADSYRLEEYGRGTFEAMFEGSVRRRVIGLSLSC